MEPHLELAARQLERMRGMNAAYHARFFSDIRFTTVVVLALFAAGLAIDRWLFLAIPFVALMGATTTAFDASYLIFSRHYATRLERYLNDQLGREVLVAHHLEDAYLFPLDSRKIVTLPIGTPATWFGFMTAFYTLIGIGSYAAGLALSLDVLADNAEVWVAAVYLISLVIVTAAALTVGWWWFVGGTGERRLSETLDQTFTG